MKRFLFQILFFSLVSVFVFFSCKENSREKNLIERAVRLTDSIPEQALLLLDSISKPETLQYDLQMKYILARVGVKKSMGQDISSDTLIFDAEKYFDTKNDLHLSGLAHLYAGNVYYEREMWENSFQSFLQAKYCAEQTKDYQLLAKSSNNIGYRYLVNELEDSAIVYFKKAVECYQNIRETDKSDNLKMRTLYSLGSAYYASDSPDSAYLYYSQALDIAKKLENREYQGILTSHLGLARRKQARYDEALEYLYAGLPEVKKYQDSVRIYLNLSATYFKMGKQDSSTYYIYLIENRLPYISDKNTLSYSYQALRLCYEAQKDYLEALKYANLESDVDQCIKEENLTRKLLEAEKNYALAQKQKDIAANRRELYYTYLGGGVGVIFLSLVFAYAYRRSKKELGCIQNEINRIHLLRKSSQDSNSNLGELLEWSRSYILKQSFGEKLVTKLNSKEILFVVLWANSYSKEVIAALLNMSLSGIDIYKMRLKDMLGSAGFTESEIEQIISSEKA